MEKYDHCPNCHRVPRPAEYMEIWICTNCNREYCETYCLNHGRNSCPNCGSPPGAFEECAYVILKNFTKSKFFDDYRIGPFKEKNYKSPDKRLGRE